MVVCVVYAYNLTIAQNSSKAEKSNDSTVKTAKKRSAEEKFDEVVGKRKQRCLLAIFYTMHRRKE